MREATTRLLELVPERHSSGVARSVAVGFLERYPHITLDLVLEDRTLDLVEESHDAAIRIGVSPPQLHRLHAGA